MRARKIALGATILAALAFGMPAEGAGDAVTNGEFEVAAPGQEQMCEVFGDTTVNVLPPDQNPGSPVWPWLASVKPCEQGTFKAAQWSTPNVTQFADFDGDGDREARIDGSVPADPFLGKSHNMWQAYPNAHQAYAANFDALRFRVESGAIPPGAYVQMSLSETPLNEPTPWLVIYIDCFLTFTSLVPDGSGQVSVDPTTATFTSGWEGCDDTAAAWAAADTAGRRSILGTLRIIQHSYWGFQTGAPVVLDGVSLAGSKVLGLA